MFLPGIYRIEKNLNFCFTLTVVLIYSETNTTECIISFLKNIFFIFICMGILTAYMCLVHCVWPGAQGSQRRVLAPLELESQMFLSCHAGVGSS